MIDKLNLRLPWEVTFAPDFHRLVCGVWGDSKRWKKSQYYERTASFQDCGLDVILHLNCQMPKVAKSHKLEILEVGKKRYDEILEICGRVVDYDAERLGIMRADLTADVADVTVDWFKRHTLVQAKQTRREFGTVESYHTVTKGRAETLYAGVTPNQIRIYDKVAERRMQHRKYLQKFNKAAKMAGFFEAEPTSFETMFGHSEDAVITRVERSVAAGDIQKLGLVTLKSLQRADLLDPFKKMLFFDSPRYDERMEDWGFTDWCVGMHLQQRVRELGYSEAYTWMRSQLGKNFYRAKKKYAPFLRVADNVVSIDAARLRNEYRASSYRQLRPAWAA